MGPVLVLIIVLHQPHPGGAVGHDDHGEALVQQGGGGLPGSAGNLCAGVSHEGGPALYLEGTNADAGQLLIRQGLDLRVRQKGICIGDGFRSQIGKVQVVDRKRLGKLPGLHRHPIPEVRGAGEIFYPLGHHVLGQPQDADGRRVLGGGAEAEHIVPPFQNIAGPAFVKGGQIRHVEADLHPAASAGGELRRLAVGGQDLIGLIQGPPGAGHIDLDHLLAGEGPGVANFGPDRNQVPGHGHRGGLHGKVRVSQAEAEGEGGANLGAVVVPVAYVYSLAVAVILLHAEFCPGAEGIRRGPGGGQLAAGIGKAQQNIRQHHAGLDPQLAEKQNIIDLVRNGRQVHRPAYVQHQQKEGIHLLQSQNVSLFAFRQQHVSGGYLPVAALAGDPGEDIHGGVAPLLQRDGVFRLRHDGAHAVQEHAAVMLFGLSPEFFQKVLLGLGPEPVVFIQPVLGGDPKAVGFQSLLHIVEKPGVHLPGSGAAFDGVPPAAAVEGNVSGPRQGELAAAL